METQSFVRLGHVTPSPAIKTAEALLDLGKRGCGEQL